VVPAECRLDDLGRPVGLEAGQQQRRLDWALATASSCGPGEAPPRMASGARRPRRDVDAAPIARSGSTTRPSAGGDGGVAGRRNGRAAGQETGQEADGGTGIAAVDHGVGR